MLILIFQLLLLILGLLLDNENAKYIPLILPVLYIFIMAPGAFRGTQHIDRKQLIEALGQNWVNAEELAKYIQKYWVALEYCTTAWARQHNCFTLSFASLGLSIWYYFADNLLIALVSFACGFLLWSMALRVNRPQSIFQDRRVRTHALSDNPQIMKEWLMAAMSMVAFAELFPQMKRFSYMSKNVLSDEYAKTAINAFRINEI